VTRFFVFSSESCFASSGGIWNPCPDRAISICMIEFIRGSTVELRFRFPEKPFPPPPMNPANPGAPPPKPPMIAAGLTVVGER
jgi:hypothetical protein